MPKSPGISYRCAVGPPMAEETFFRLKSMPVELFKASSTRSTEMNSWYRSILFTKGGSVSKDGDESNKLHYWTARQLNSSSALQLHSSTAVQLPSSAAPELHCSTATQLHSPTVPHFQTFTPDVHSSTPPNLYSSTVPHHRPNAPHCALAASHPTSKASKIRSSTDL